MPEPIISVSGLRGIVGDSLTPDRAVRYVAAFASGLRHGPVVVSRDGRATGEMILHAVQSALQGTGHDVINAEVAATPTTGVLVRSHQAAGGVQISASHNPPAYNGVKLFSAEGRVISADAGQQVIDRYRSGSIEWVDHENVGMTRKSDDSIRKHLSLLLDTVKVDLIRSKRFKVVLDANHGAGSILGTRLLDELECHVTMIGAEPNGQFAHPPEPTAENLASVCETITSRGADVGFCQDPDADRLAVIDATGRYVGEEYTLALCLDHILRHSRGPVVTNCSTSRMSEDIAEKHGAPLFRSPVGEANVVDLMLKQNAVFGGEGNGGPIDPRVGYVRDSFVGMALILNAMAERDQTVSQLVKELPRYAIHKTKLALDLDEKTTVFELLDRHFSDAKSDHLDGLRLDWPDKWLLVRGSNTEPIVRIIAEARTTDQAQQLCKEAMEILSGR